LEGWLNPENSVSETGGCMPKCLRSNAIYTAYFVNYDTQKVVERLKVLVLIDLLFVTRTLTEELRFEICIAREKINI
jgi:hypothetical protein